MGRIVWFHQEMSGNCSRINTMCVELGSYERERRGSVVVSTPAYHAADWGSNPARTRRDY